MRVLVVDDEPEIRALVRRVCEAGGHVVDELDAGAGVVEQMRHTPPDAVLLDLMLTDMSGLEVCRQIRAAHLLMPVLFLSAKDEEVDVVLGLEVGADDYISKPFRPRELLARLDARVRSVGGSSGDRLAFRGLTVLVAERRVERHGKAVALTHTEFDLLVCLARAAGRPVPRDAILATVWGYDQRIETRLVDVHIRNLRRKIEDDPSNPHFILSVPGVGYRFAAAAPD